MGNTIDSRPVFSQEASPCSRPSTPVSSLLYQAKFSSEMLARVVRILLRYDPQAVCRFLCSSRSLQQIVREGSDEAAELNAARSLLTQQRLHELRVAAGFEGGILALAQSFSQQFSIAQRVEKELKAAGLVQSFVNCQLSRILTPWSTLALCPRCPVYADAVSAGAAPR